MIYYKEEEIEKMESTTRKWVILNVVFGVVSLVTVTIFCFLATYEFHLLYQILSAIVLSLFSIFLIYSIDQRFIEIAVRKKHYILMFLSGEDHYEGEVLQIGKITTVYRRMEAYPVEIQIDEGKSVTLYLKKEFTPDFKIGDHLSLVAKSRFIYESEVHHE